MTATGKVQKYVLRNSALKKMREENNL